MTGDATVLVVVRTSTETEAGALAFLRLARRYPAHWESARMVSCEVEEHLPAGFPKATDLQGWNVIFRMPALGLVESMLEERS